MLMTKGPTARKIKFKGVGNTNFPSSAQNFDWLRDEDDEDPRESASDVPRDSIPTQDRDALQRQP
jgi:hypothetical protein